MQLDHVVIAVADLGVAAEALEARRGLASVEGGRHPGWGTANRIVLLGETYLELIAVVDEAQAAETAVGRCVTAGAGTEGLLAWAVRTEELDAVASRLGLVPQPGSRQAPDGTTLRWRSAGLEEAAADPSLPFFIGWEAGAMHPGRSAREQPWSMAGLSLRGDLVRLSAWLGQQALPVRIESGNPAILGVVLHGPGGETVLEG